MATNYTPSFLLFGYHPKAPNDFVGDQQSVERPSLHDLEDTKAKDFTQEIMAAREIAKNSIKKAQELYESSYNRKHKPILLDMGDKVLINIHSLELPESQIKGRSSPGDMKDPLK